MAKTKQSKKTKKVSKISSKRSGTVHGLEHDFVLIAGGGFVVLILIMMFLFR